MSTSDIPPFPDDAALPGEWTATEDRPAEPAALATAGPARSPGTTDLLTALQTRGASSDRLPMLEVVFDRLERLLGQSMRGLLGENAEVRLEGVVTQRFDELGGQGDLPSMLTVLKATEWDGHGLLVIDGPLIYSVVDVLLGSRRNVGPTRLAGRPYTTIETTLIERLVRLALPDLGRAFAPIAPVQFRQERIETSPRFALIARPGDACVMARVRVELEDRGGTLLFVLPHATLEPVRDRLLQSFMGEKLGRDTIWEQHLASEVWQAGIELRAVLEERTALLGEVMGLKVGSVLKLGLKPDAPVTLRAGPVPMMSGTVGRRGDTIVLQVDHLARRPEVSR